MEVYIDILMQVTKDKIQPLYKQKISQETIKILEQKITKVEASALKVFEERNTEVAVLMKSLNL
jgi:tyrosine-protein phosphatase YwqE